MAGWIEMGWEMKMDKREGGGGEKDDGGGSGVVGR